MSKHINTPLIVDIFAGGGGVSTGIFQATGRHPNTRHFIADVYEVCPRGATQGRPVSWLHLSPDCTHHSQAAHGDGKPGGVQRWGNGALDIATPMGTVTASGGYALSATTLIQLRKNCDSRDITDPLKTVTSGGNHHAAVVAFISSYYTDESNRSRSIEDPVATITTENRLGLIECALSPEHSAGAQRVAAFLIRYYSAGGQLGDITDPMATITAKDRMALVTVMIQGQPHVIVDIGLRMLQPAELFRAQGFPSTYSIEHGHDGRKFSKSTQVRLCGNSVPPGLMEAICRANYPQIDTESVKRVAA